MRTSLLAAGGLLVLVVGGSCLPFIDTTKREPVPGKQLGISLTEPAEEETVPEGSLVNIDYAAANLTEESALITLIAESREPGLLRTEIARIEFASVGKAGRVQWETTGFSGLYAIIGRIEAAGLSAEETAAGRITVDGAPQFEFTAPTGDVTLLLPDDGTLRIAWRASDESATLSIGVDPDTDHNNGNEVFIDESTVPTESAERSIDWDGTDADGNDVAEGTYNLFARVTDEVNDVLYVDGPGLITLDRQ